MTEPNGKTRPGPLDGVRVLDFTRVLAGPFCTRMLSDLGADVIKLEPPGADFTRGMGRRINGLSAYFTQQNAGKRNISLDMTKPAAREVVLELLEHMDVLVQNFRPGVMDTFGLDDATLRARNPRLIVCHISGFGHDSTEEDKRAFAGVVHAMAGVVHLQSIQDDVHPVDSALAMGDTYTGSHALAAILAALYQREHTGRGQVIDMAMHDVMLAVNDCCPQYLWDSPDKHRAHRGAVLVGKDGALLYAGDAIFNFEKLAALLGRPELVEDPRFVDVPARQANREDIYREIEKWVAAQPSIADAERKLDAAGLPCGRVRTMDDALASRQAAHRGMIVELSDRGPDGGTVKVVNSPYHFSDAHTGPRGPAAYRGENNRTILTEFLAYDDARLTALEDAGVLYKSQKRKR